MSLRDRQSGFAIIEILVVIAIIATVAAIGFVAVNNLTGDNKVVSSTGQPSSSPVTHSSPTPIPELIYVSMGDSYTAGDGSNRAADIATDPSGYDTTGPCARSKYAAQYIIARDLQYSLTDASCNAAFTLNVLSVAQGKNPKQVSAINSDTQLVTMTIGGNDALLAVLVLCIQESKCSPSGAAAKIVDNNISALPTLYKKIYNEIHRRAANAKIRHAGYPPILSIPGEPVGNCTFMSTSEQKMFYSRLTRVNSIIRQTIEKYAKDTGVDAKYVDPFATDSPFLKRDDGQMLDGCSTSSKRYIVGPKDGGVNTGIWHPNIYGQRHYAEIYKRSL